MTTFPNPLDPVSALTRADGDSEAHSAAITAANATAGAEGTVFFPPNYSYNIGTTTLNMTANTEGAGVRFADA